MKATTQPIAEFKKSLDELIERLTHTSEEKWQRLDPELVQNIRALEELARGRRFAPKIREEITRLPWFKEKTILTRAFYEKWETSVEGFHAHHLSNKNLKGCDGCMGDIIRHLQVEQTRIKGVSLKRTCDFAFQEGKALKIVRNSHVALIGSGPFPESAISLALDFGCKVTGIDYDPRAIEISKKIVARFGLESQIDFRESKAEEHHYGDYSHVYVAVLTDDKEKVVEEIFSTNPAILASCRTVRDTRALIYKPIEALPSGVEIQEEIFPENPRTIMHTLILKSE